MEEECVIVIECVIVDFVLFACEGLKRSVFFDAITGHEILGAKAAA